MNEKNLLLHIFETVLGAIILCAPPFLITIGGIGFGYLLGDLINVPVSEDIKLYSVAIGVFLGCIVSALWISFFFGKMEACFNDEHQKMEEMAERIYQTEEPME